MILGLDVGGTHTDVVVINGREVVSKTKILVETDGLLESVCAGIIQATEDLEPEAIRRVVVSTTLATNAVVQGDLEPVGVLVASGPGRNPSEFAVGPHYYPVAGAVDHRGREIAPIRREEVKAIGAELQEQGVGNLALVSKFSTRNPALELAMLQVLNDRFQSITLGHQVSGQLNFPRRIATAYLNSAVAGICRDFYATVQKCMQRQGLRVPLEILKADGGTMASELSQRYAVETILSGPAASIMGALPHAAASGVEVVLDIGGTTTDIAILVDGVPLLEPLGITIGGYKTLVRALRTRSLGVGGDSWVRAVAGRLAVGPERKGRAMAYGGPEPTPTDALIALGELDGGNKARAMEAMRRLSFQLGIDAEAAAPRVIALTCEQILAGIDGLVEAVNRRPVYTIHEMLHGREFYPDGLIVIGGPAAALAPKLGQLRPWAVKVPANFEVANAIGAAIARTTCEVTVVADTAQGVVVAAEEGYRGQVEKDTKLEDIVELAFGLLRRKALDLGAAEDDLQMEVLEAQEFSMVRGFVTEGKNMRVRVQIKPGLVRPYREVAA